MMRPFALRRPSCLCRVLYLINYMCLVLHIRTRGNWHLVPRQMDKAGHYLTSSGNEIHKVSALSCFLATEGKEFEDCDTNE